MSSAQKATTATIIQQPTTIIVGTYVFDLFIIACLVVDCCLFQPHRWCFFNLNNKKRIKAEPKTKKPTKGKKRWEIFANNCNTKTTKWMLDVGLDSFAPKKEHKSWCDIQHKTRVQPHIWNIFSLQYLIRMMCIRIPYQFQLLLLLLISFSLYQNHNIFYPKNNIQKTNNEEYILCFIRVCKCCLLYKVLEGNTTQFNDGAIDCSENDYILSALTIVFKTLIFTIPLRKVFSLIIDCNFHWLGLELQ